MKKIYHQKFERGKAVTSLTVKGNGKGTGTKITFKPDALIFDELVYSFETLSHRLRELSFLNKGLKIILKDKRTNVVKEFFHEGGLIDFVIYLNKNKDVLHSKPIYMNTEKDSTQFEVSVAI